MTVPQMPEAAAIDPVCGMKVDPATAKHRIEHEGRPFYFCSAALPREVRRRPGEAICTAASASRTSAAPKGTIYTCPMHPQIRQEGPGSCPICGMALEPLDVTAEAGPNAELST